MPEIGEVARIVHYLKKHVVGKTIAAVKTQEDEIVFGKVGTSAAAFQKAMTGKKVLDARQQGKYFWLVMSTPPHPLMHFGMTGWMKFSTDPDSVLYSDRGKKGADPEPWPPKFWKFVLDMGGQPKCEVAFVDARRLGRIRLVDVEADKMRSTTPLKENGPDPVIDREVLTRAWLGEKMRSKKVPIKALLLDQANISGVGNWVGDEVLYQARIHPEQYSNTFSDAQIGQLHDALMEVCRIAVETNADSNLFPDNWLMRHRWGNGKKGKDRLPTGEKIIFLKVGGRTSAVIPSVQKKTGAVAADVSEDAEEEEGDGDVKEDLEEDASEVKSRKRTKLASNGTKPASSPSTPTSKASKKKAIRKDQFVGDDRHIDAVKKEEEEKEETRTPKKRKTIGEETTTEKSTKPSSTDSTPGRRRSARISRG